MSMNNFKNQNAIKAPTFLFLLGALAFNLSTIPGEGIGSFSLSSVRGPTSEVADGEATPPADDMGGSTVRSACLLTSKVQAELEKGDGTKTSASGQCARTRQYPDGFKIDAVVRAEIGATCRVLNDDLKSVPTEDMIRVSVTVPVINEQGKTAGKRTTRKCFDRSRANFDQLDTYANQMLIEAADAQAEMAHKLLQDQAAEQQAQQAIVNCERDQAGATIPSALDVNGNETNLAKLACYATNVGGITDTQQGAQYFEAHLKRPIYALLSSNDKTKMQQGAALLQQIAQTNPSNQYVVQAVSDLALYAQYRVKIVGVSEKIDAISKNMTREKWDSLSPEQQKKIIAAMKEAATYQKNADADFAKRLGIVKTESNDPLSDFASGTGLDGILSGNLNGYKTSFDKFVDQIEQKYDYTGLIRNQDTGRTRAGETSGTIPQVGAPVVNPLSSGSANQVQGATTGRAGRPIR